MGPVHIRMLRHLAAELMKTFLCLLLVIFPVFIGVATRLARSVTFQGTTADLRMLHSF